MSDFREANTFEKRTDDQVDIRATRAPQTCQPLVSTLVQRIMQPGWTTSLMIHLAILVTLALWIFPTITKTTTVVEGEFATVPRPEIPFVDLEPIKIDVQQPVWEPDLSTELESDDDEHTDLFDEIQTEPVHSTPEPIVPVAAKSQLDSAKTKEVVNRKQIIKRKRAARVDKKILQIDEIQKRVIDAGGKSGEVQFSLVWKSFTDLDLHVITPLGERIYYKNRQAQCSGMLDVDRNAKKTTMKPVENVRWLPRQAVSGRYTIVVHLFKRRGPEHNLAYTLMAKTGENVDLRDEKIGLSDRLNVYRYVYFAPSISEADRARKMEKWKAKQKEEEDEATQKLAAIRRYSPKEESELWDIFNRYPHTDAAIEALKRISGDGSK